MDPSKAVSTAVGMDTFKGIEMSAAEAEIRRRAILAVTPGGKTRLDLMAMGDQKAKLAEARKRLNDQMDGKVIWNPNGWDGGATPDCRWASDNGVVAQPKEKKAKVVKPTGHSPYCDCSICEAYAEQGGDGEPEQCLTDEDILGKRGASEVFMPNLKATIQARAESLKFQVEAMKVAGREVAGSIHSIPKPLHDPYTGTGLTTQEAAAALKRWTIRVQAVPPPDDDFLKKRANEFIKKRMLKANAEGFLHVHNWDEEEVPTVDVLRSKPATWG